MSYLDVYRKRLQANGESSSDGIVFASKKTIANNFSSSLFSEIVLINDVEFEAIISQEEASDDKKLLLKPDTKINIGSVVRIKENNYLAMDFLGEGINEVYPTATLKLCNNALTLQQKQVCTVVGKNDFDEDIVVCNPSEISHLPCIVERSTVTSNSENAINLPEGKANVTIPFTVNDSIEIGKSIDLYTEKYEIQDIDYTKSLGETGLMILNVEKKVGES